jgi:hypothetical protein
MLNTLFLQVLCNTLSRAVFGAYVSIFSGHFHFGLTGVFCVKIILLTDISPRKEVPAF